MSPAGAEPRRLRWSVPPADVSTNRWLDEQENISRSLQLLVRESIQRDGYIDVVNRPIEQLPRRGRPPADGVDSSAPSATAVSVGPADAAPAAAPASEEPAATTVETPPVVAAPEVPAAEVNAGLPEATKDGVSAVAAGGHSSDETTEFEQSGPGSQAAEPAVNSDVAAGISAMFDMR